jgi:hypothetical protein
LLRIVGLAVVVLIAHLSILNSASIRLNLQPAPATLAFTTRSITLPTPAPELPPMMKPVVKPLVKPPVKSASKPATKPPLQAPAASPALTTTSIDTPVASSPAPVAETPVAQAKEAPAEPVQPETAPALDSNAAQTAAAFTALTSAKHLYSVIFTKNGNTNTGKAELNWRQDGGNYVLDLSASYLSIPVFQWNSTGRLMPQGLLPTRFSDKRFRKSEVAAHFNYEQGKVTFSANTPDAALLAGGQDRGSVILHIAGLLAGDPARYLPTTAFSLQTVSATEAEPWLFIVNEPETLNLPSGPQTALRITRNPRREFDQKIELWFAPALNYLPVRFRFTETNGDFVDAQLQSSQALPDVKLP